MPETPAHVRLGDLCGVLADADADQPICMSCHLAAERGGEPNPEHARCVDTHRKDGERA